MITDPIADMLTRIKNAYMARHQQVRVPHSKLKEALASILKDHGFIKDVIVKKEKHHKVLIISLAYINNQPKLTQARRVSCPSRRVYVSKDNIPKVMGGLGVAIVSTPKGLMSGTEARKKGLGGEVICTVW